MANSEKWSFGKIESVAKKHGVNLINYKEKEISFDTIFDIKCMYFQPAQYISEELKNEFKKEGKVIAGILFNTRRTLIITNNTSMLEVTRFLNENNYKGCAVCQKSEVFMIKCDQCTCRTCHCCSMKMMLFNVDPDISDMYLALQISSFKCPLCRAEMPLIFIMNFYQRVIDKISMFNNEHQLLLKKLRRMDPNSEQKIEHCRKLIHSFNKMHMNSSKNQLLVIGYIRQNYELGTVSKIVKYLCSTYFGIKG
eukprot:527343_1